jgi:uncharacterized membrane protein YhaH (DUF805 family)
MRKFWGWLLFLVGLFALIRVVPSGGGGSVVFNASYTVTMLVVVAVCFIGWFRMALMSHKKKEATRNDNT